MAMLAGVSVICSSCVAPSGGYASYTVPTSGGTFSAGVSWTDASYDSNGFPIFGYSQGRPVYGYTASGAAIFTIAALTALCFVPHWGPASWYRGGYHYPSGIHRVSAPPKFPKGHRPGVRPPSGFMPPKAPAHHVAQPHHVAPRPGVAPHSPAPRPGVAPHNPAHRPGVAPIKPQPHAANRPAAPFRSANQAKPGAPKRVAEHRIGSDKRRSAAHQPGPADHKHRLGKL